MEATQEFKKEVISINTPGIRKAEALCVAKLDKLRQCQEEALKYVSTIDFKPFCADIVGYVMEDIKEQNKALISLNIKLEKIIDMLGIDLSKLTDLAKEYYEINAEVKIKDNEPYSEVVKDHYKTYTSTPEQNKRLKDAKSAITAIEKMKQYGQLNLISVSNGLNRMVILNQYTGQLEPSPGFVMG